MKPFPLAQSQLETFDGANMKEASKSLMNWMAGDKLLWVDPQGKEGYCRESFFFLCSFELSVS